MAGVQAVDKRRMADRYFRDTSHLEDLDLEDKVGPGDMLSFHGDGYNNMSNDDVLSNVKNMYHNRDVEHKSYIRDDATIADRYFRDTSSVDATEVEKRVAKADGAMF